MLLLVRPAEDDSALSAVIGNQISPICIFFVFLGRSVVSYTYTRSLKHVFALKQIVVK